MAELFTAKYAWVWALALAVALFYPVRQLIWVLSVRRAERKHGPTDEARRETLKRRAAITSALLCLIFSVFYVNQLFQGR